MKQKGCVSLTHTPNRLKASVGFMLPFLESMCNFKSFLWSVSTLLSIFVVKKKGSDRDKAYCVGCACLRCGGPGSIILPTWQNVRLKAQPVYTLGPH